MFLCRRWRTNYWRYSDRSIHPFPSRLSTCPRSPLPVSLTGTVFALLSRRQNSWWKYIISYSSLRGIVEQNVDIPAPLGRGRSRGGLGFHPGQSSTAFSGADHRSGTAEQIVDIPAPRGGQDLPSSASSSGLPGTANHGVFRTFPRGKKVRIWARTRGRNCSPSRAHPRRRLSWRISSRTQMVCGCAFQAVGGNFWAQIQKFGGLGEGWDGALVMRQPTTSFARISSCSCPLCSRSSHLEFCTLFPCPCIWQSLFRASGCCLWLRKLDFSGDDFFRGGNAWYNSGYIHLCRGADAESHGPFYQRFFSHSTLTR